MAKTKLLAKIESDAALLYAECDKIQKHLDGGTAAGDHEAWIAFAAAQTAESALEASVRALRDHMAKWDGSTSLKNVFKSKKELTQKRDDAKQKFQNLSIQATMIQTLFKTLKMEFLKIDK